MCDDALHLIKNKMQLTVCMCVEPLHGLTHARSLVVWEGGLFVGVSDSLALSVPDSLTAG